MSRGTSDTGPRPGNFRSKSNISRPESITEPTATIRAPLDRDAVLTKSPWLRTGIDWFELR